MRTDPSGGFQFNVQNRAQVGRIVPHIGRQKVGTEPPTHILDNGYVGGRSQRVLHVQDQQLQSVDVGQWYLEDGNAPSDASKPARPKRSVALAGDGVHGQKPP